MCPDCHRLRNSPAESYVEKLLETLLSADSDRVGMAVDVLTKWLHEERAVVPLLYLLSSDVDAHRLVLAARGLGWLGDRAAVPALAGLLLDPDKPFVSRIAAADSLGLIGGKQAQMALQQACASERTSVAAAASRALRRLVGQGKEK